MESQFPVQTVKREIGDYARMIYLRKISIVRPGRSSANGSTYPLGNLVVETEVESNTGRDRLIRSHSSARFRFELSGNLN